MLKVKLKINRHGIEVAKSFVKRFFGVDKVTVDGRDVFTFVVKTEMSLEEIYIKLEQRSYDHFDSIIESISILGINLECESNSNGKYYCIFYSKKKELDKIIYKYDKEPEMIHACQVLYKNKEMI